MATLELGVDEKKLIQQEKTKLKNKRLMTKKRSWKPTDGSGVIPERHWKKLSPKTKTATSIL